MDFVSEYAFPIALGLVLAVFFFSMPKLKDCSLGDDSASRRALCRGDVIIMAVISLVYGAVAFYRLGNTVSPESFTSMEGRTATVQLPDDAEASSIRVYCGAGIGEYKLEYAKDGSNFVPLSSLAQSHVEDLKWNYIDLDAPIRGGVVHIIGSGNVWLGEVVFVDSEGGVIPISTSLPALSDEQDLSPEKQNYMNSSYFDEIYHARTAWENLNGVYPYEITHPPLGKLIIALGISIFGMTPFGWRFSGTLFGVLMLPIMYVFLKKLFGGKAVPAAGTILFASDFMHYVQTRIATIDTYSVFFILLMYLFMYLFITGEKKRDLALSGLFFGMGAASKWTCMYAGAGLAVIWLLWVIYSVREGRMTMNRFLKNVGFCVVFFVLLPCGIYYLSYFPYAAAKGNTPLFSSDYTKMVLANQEYMFNYHSSIVAEHPYSSKWYQWVLDIRPILYYLEYFDDGTRSSFGAFVNPVLCWGGLISLFILGYFAVSRRDKTAIFILLGYFAQLIPWMFVSRITFEYHYFPCSVFLVMSVSYIFNIFRQNARNWKLHVYGFAALSVVIFAFFYPALSGKIVNNAVATKLLGWLPTWPF